MSKQGVELLWAAVLMADRLNGCPGPGPDLDEVIGTIVETTGAACGALFAVKYGFKKNFTYARLSSRREAGQTLAPDFFNQDTLQASFFPNRTGPESTEVEVIPVPAAGAGEPGSERSSRGGWTQGRDHHYGLLVLAGSDGRLAESERVSFLGLAAKLLSGWFARLNSEKVLADILDFLPYPTMVVDTGGYVRVWNPAYEERTQMPASEVLGKNDYSPAMPFYGQRRPVVPDLLLNPDPQLESTYHEFNKQGDVVTGLAYCPAVHDGPIFLTYKTTLLRDLNDRITGAIHVVRDVTHEREVEIELRRSEQRYRRITKFASIGILLLARDRIVYYNEYVAELFRGLGLEASPATLNDLISREDQEPVSRILETVFEGLGEVEPFEFRLVNEDKVRFFRGHASLLEYEESPTIQLILDDITDQKELAEKDRQNQMRLYHEDRLTSLGVMAAGIAHELNQPLNTVRMIAEAVLIGRRKGWDLDLNELFDDMDMVRRQVRRMDEVIQNIRDFAREDQHATRASVDVNEAVNNIFAMIGRQLEARNIQVEKEFLNDPPPVSANLHQLEQVIMNLIVNARQALESSDKKKKELRVWTGRRDETIMIGVEDNAVGIPAEISARVFDPFFTTKPVGQGTGLGLSISRSILADLGGRVEFENNSKGGATFVIHLPIPGGPVENPGR